jgi:DNA polymerase-3 subunit delta'
MVMAQKRFVLVDAVRDLENEARFRPYEGRARTFIIDDADKMNDAASNALLKTLEEPASTSRIILVTSRPDALFTTIRSRCQVFRFAPVRGEQIARLLIETRQVPEPDARLAARFSEGSVSRALSIDVEQMRERRSFALDVLRQAFLRHDRVSLLRASEKLAEAKNKEYFDEDLDLLAALIRDIWGLSLGGDVVHADVMSDLVEIAEHADTQKLAELMGEIESIRERFAVNINKKFAVDDLFVRMAA